MCKYVPWVILSWNVVLSQPRKQESQYQLLLFRDRDIKCAGIVMAILKNEPLFSHDVLIFLKLKPRSQDEVSPDLYILLK